MDKEVLVKCITHDSDPFLASKISPNTGKTLYSFHIDQGCTVVKYSPEIHDKPIPVMGNCRINENERMDDDARTDFKNELRNDRFLIHQTYDQESLVILDREIKVMRPITLVDGTRYILAYLPTQITDEKGNLSRQNRAFFIQKNPDGTKDVLGSKDVKLIEEFVVNPFQTYSDCRWELDDVKKYYFETELTDPKMVFEKSVQNVKKYFEYQDEGSYSVFVLWNFGTYLYELFNAYPYLNFTGTKRAGKSKNLDYQKLICYNAIKSSDISTSAQFRLIESIGCTVLLDETESFKSPKSEKHQDTLTLLHTGFMKGDSAIRSEGSNGNFTPTSFRTYGPKALAHINSFGDVLEDRCIPFQILRSTDKKILNSDPDKSDREILEIRNYYYRLFLDYGDEIYGLIPEAKNILNVSSRELKIWTPVITLALFFERHGVESLTAQIKAKCEAIYDERSQNDEEHSPEGRFLKFIDEQIREVPKKDGLIQFNIIYNEFRNRLSVYGFEEYHKQKFVSDKLIQLGFEKSRSSNGMMYNVSNEKIDAAFTRMNIPFQTKLEVSHVD